MSPQGVTVPVLIPRRDAVLLWHPSLLWDQVPLSCFVILVYQGERSTSGSCQSLSAKQGGRSVFEWVPHHPLIVAF